MLAGRAMNAAAFVMAATASSALATDASHEARAEPAGSHVAIPASGSPLQSLPSDEIEPCGAGTYRLSFGVTRKNSCSRSSQSKSANGQLVLSVDDEGAAKLELGVSRHETTTSRRHGRRGGRSSHRESWTRASTWRGEARCEDGLLRVRFATVATARARGPRPHDADLPKGDESRTAATMKCRAKTVQAYPPTDAVYPASVEEHEEPAAVPALICHLQADDSLGWWGERIHVVDGGLPFAPGKGLRVDARLDDRGAVSREDDTALRRVE